MSEAAIKLKNVSKTFKLPHEKQSSLKGILINFYKQKRSYEKQEVLKDISFEIQKGEFFGIVGRNGSGKSTLLKLLAGIYTPDRGTVQVSGKLTPFIELGVGFNPELTGRENVFLNGALLGFNRKQMSAMYDEIVKFAELERFMDQKLKNYSSGMQVRLAFSIAIRAKSDILLIDEVLAVGDESFQRKSMKHFVNLKREKRTVVFVTHDMSQVRRFCDRAIYINKGKIIAEGKPQAISELYTKDNLDSSISNEVKRSDIQGEDVQLSIKFIGGKKIEYGGNLKFELKWENHPEIKNVGIAIIKDTGEYIFGANTILDKINLRGSTIQYGLECNIVPGEYSIAVGLFGETDAFAISHHPSIGIFVVEPTSATASWAGITKLNHEWS